MDEIHVHKTKKSICAHFAESPCKLLGYRRESKAPNKTLGFPINLKIIIKIVIQVNLMQK